MWWRVLQHIVAKVCDLERWAGGRVVIGYCFLSLKYGVEFLSNTCSNSASRVSSGMKVGAGSLISHAHMQPRFCLSYWNSFHLQRMRRTKITDYLVLPPSPSLSLSLTPSLLLVPYLWSTCHLLSGQLLETMEDPVSVVDAVGSVCRFVASPPTASTQFIEEAKSRHCFLCASMVERTHSPWSVKHQFASQL